MKKILLLLLTMIVFVPVASAERFWHSCNFNEKEYPATYPFIMNYIHEIQDKWQPSEFMEKKWCLWAVFEVKIDRTGKVHWVKFKEWTKTFGTEKPFLAKEKNKKKFIDDIENILLTSSPGPFPKELEDDEIVIQYYFTYTPFPAIPHWIFAYADAWDVMSCGVPNGKRTYDLSFKISYNSNVKRGFFPRKPIRKGVFDYSELKR